MKTQSKIIFANVARNIFLAGILFIVPLFYSTKLYNSFRLPKNTLFILLTTVAFFFTLMYFLEKKSIDLKKYKFILYLTGIYSVLKILSWAFSEHKDISFWGSYLRAEGLLLWISLILFFVLVLFNEWDKEKLKNYSLVIVGTVLATTMYGILQKFGIINVGWSKDVAARIISTMGNPLNFSSFLILTFPFIYYAFRFNKNIVIKIITVITAGLFIYNLYATKSRSSWIAFLFALFIFITFHFYKKHKKIFISLLIIAAILSTSFGYIGFNYYNKFEQPILKRIFSVFDPHDNSTQQRFIFWQGSFNAFMNKPILGWGLDSLSFAFDKNFPTKLSDMPETHIDRAHNWHLDVLVMEGLLIWLFNIFVLIFAFWKSLKLIKKEKKEFAHIGLIYCYVFSACLLQFFFVFTLISAYIISIFSLALVFSVSQKPTEPPYEIKSKTIEKLKKNSNLYVILAVTFTSFILFVVLKPIIANRELTLGLFKRDDVLGRIEKAKDIFPCQYYKNKLGVYSSNFSKTNQSIKIFQSLIEQYPNHYHNYIALATTYNRIGNHKTADQTYQNAIDNFPTRHNIYWQWGESLIKRGENEKAIDIYKKAIDIDPEVAMSYYKLGVLYEKIGDMENAKKYKQIAFDKNLPYVPKNNKQTIATNQTNIASNQIND